MCQGLSTQVQTLKNDLSRQAELDEKNRRLLDMRTEELKGFQSLLATDDILSPSEVIRMVDTLNSEILQTAAFMAETETFHDDLGLGSIEGIERMVGPGMATLMLEVQAQDDRETIIQTALQTALAGYSAWQINSWSQDPNVSEGLARAYRNISEKEIPTVAAKWRALTHAQFKSHFSTEQIATGLLATATETLIAGRCLLPADRPTAGNALKAKYWGRLMLLSELIQKVDKAVGEEITSKHLIVYTAPFGEFFHPEYHSDVYGDSRTAKNAPLGRILCSTDLGLASIRNIGKGDRRERGFDILLKPKVILESAWKVSQSVQLP
ncbi:hypothetical protein C8J56DRAFT_797921 [Mycena floridula]|nr:hypothetical protein C8J56DRAFT_797921 [Mycena floridula]